MLIQGWGSVLTDMFDHILVHNFSHVVNATLVHILNDMFMYILHAIFMRISYPTFRHTSYVMTMHTCDDTSIHILNAILKGQYTLYPLLSHALFMHAPPAWLMRALNDQQHDHIYIEELTPMPPTSFSFQFIVFPRVTRAADWWGWGVTRAADWKG